MMRRAAPLLLFALLPSCASQPSGPLPLPPPPPPAHHASLPAANVVPRFCGPGSDGSVQVVERGVGGTGIAPTDQRTAERGIGGTGIVGVITGFGSVCVNRLEVALKGSLQVEVDGHRIAGTTLRAGQVVAIGAEANGTGLRARSIAVRHEVSGPVEVINVGGNDVVIVAGQRVAVLPSTLGYKGLAPGDWVAVSGLRTADGTIVATRIDQRDPGQVVVRGLLASGDNGTWRIGTLALRSLPGRAASIGAQVAASGRYDETGLSVEEVSPDLLASDPPAYFGPAVQPGGDRVLRSPREWTCASEWRLRGAGRSAHRRRTGAARTCRGVSGTREQGIPRHQHHRCERPHRRAAGLPVDRSAAGLPARVTRRPDAVGRFA